MKKMIAVLVFTLTMTASFANAVSTPLADSGWSIVTEEQAGGAVNVPLIYGVTEDSVIIEIDKIFNQGFDGLNYEPVSFKIEKTSDQAVSNIIINDEYIVNSTGTEWFDFHMTIVNGQTPFAGFNQNYIPDGDLLETVTFANNTGFNNLPVELHFQDADQQGVLSEIGNDNFMPGFFGGMIMIVTNPLMQVGDSFTIQETPSVPEPATVLLMSFGALAMLRKKINP